ncbi:MAG: redoxin domain-containing protein [Crenarchaeota archaeon]|nr:redoxin domain-containing protein [Thermoproteota archaeon]MDA1125166.1 redoxin domain-containing protein [Thermoproteota archaeon]
MTLQKGDMAEDFELLAHDGASIRLSSYKNSKNVVLCFYPKNHLFACPSKKVFEMAKSVISVYSKIIATETVVFAVSVDSVDSQSDFVKEYEIPYIHLSDPKKIACKKYAGTNIAGLAKRSTFVIDKNGTIQDVMREINVSSHGQEILDSLNKIKV